ncbi:MAG: GNAT family N-acetyltransferase [Bacteroidales bacterium]|jgi:N-acetylglutamate synthase-like GNAT family acetyltransferase|nr:GNAT family N-acetyltransferase [Bacteroidales bacterium]
MKYAVITYKSPDYGEMLDLRKSVLRDPLGLVFSPEELRLESEDCFLICRDHGRIIGCCILTRISSGQVKLRQMAVHPSFQGKSVGAGLLLYAEQCAGKAGYSSIILHARETAIGFYEKYHYRITGTPFIEVGIPHVAMQKHIPA